MNKIVEAGLELDQFMLQLIKKHKITPVESAMLLNEIQFKVLSIMNDHIGKESDNNGNS